MVNKLMWWILLVAILASIISILYAQQQPTLTEAVGEVFWIERQNSENWSVGIAFYYNPENIFQGGITQRFNYYQENLPNYVTVGAWVRVRYIWEPPWTVEFLGLIDDRRS